MSNRYIVLVAALLGTHLAGACSSGPAPAGPEAGTFVMTVHAGNNQQVAPSTQLPVQPAVRVVRDGVPVSGLQVVFTITSGGGTGGGQSVTDGDGIAHAPVWTLGPVLGEQRMVASLTGQQGSTLLFSAYATLPVLVTLEGYPTKRTFSERHYNTNQIYVRALDTDQRPVAGVGVIWQVLSGPGRISSAEALTDELGFARLRLLTFDGPAAVRVEARSDKVLTSPAFIQWVFEAQ